MWTNLTEKRIIFNNGNSKLYGKKRPHMNLKFLKLLCARHGNEYSIILKKSTPLKSESSPFITWYSFIILDSLSHWLPLTITTIYSNYFLLYPIHLSKFLLSFRNVHRPRPSTEILLNFSTPRMQTRLREERCSPPHCMLLAARWVKESRFATLL